MSFTPYIRPEAELDIKEAASWYQMQQSGLGDKFLDKVSAAIQKMIKAPFSYPVIYQNVRRILLNKFPFGIYYFIDNDSIIIIAVMHGSRNPNHWKKRR